MRGVLIALRAMLLNLKAIRVIATILARDVVAVLALFAGQSNLRTDVVASHCRAFRLVTSHFAKSVFVVPRAGLEPATQRL